MLKELLKLYFFIIPATIFQASKEIIFDNGYVLDIFAEIIERKDKKQEQLKAVKNYLQECVKDDD
jgi:hypothetical protein